MHIGDGKEYTDICIYIYIYASWDVIEYAYMNMDELQDVYIERDRFAWCGEWSVRSHLLKEVDELLET